MVREEAGGSWMTEVTMTGGRGETLVGRRMIGVSKYPKGRKSPARRLLERGKSPIRCLLAGPSYPQHSSPSGIPPRSSLTPVTPLIVLALRSTTSLLKVQGNMDRILLHFTKRNIATILYGLGTLPEGSFSCGRKGSSKPDVEIRTKATGSLYYCT